MHEGEVVFGGVGSGLYGMLAFAIIAVFIAGLMVGRTPEYLGKKIEAFEMKMAALVVLVMPMIVLVGAAVAVATDAGRSGHFQSGTARLQRDAVCVYLGRQQQRQRLCRPRRNIIPSTTCRWAIVMLVARYWLAIPTLAIAGSLARKKVTPTSAGTLPTHTPLFIVFLVGTVILVGVP